MTDKQYEYHGEIRFICEYMTIYHDAWVVLDELYSLEEAEQYLLDQADVFIKDYYGFIPSEFATVDKEILWLYWPEDLNINQEIYE